MLKKFLIGTFVVFGLALAMSVSASYDFGSTTLRVGSTGDYVRTLQTLVGAGVDGNFGPMTKAKVMAWQAANGLEADGVFGPLSMAKANLGLGGTTSTGLPAGCTSTMGWSSISGVKCDTTVASLPAGCTSTMGWSPISGVKCDTTVASLPAGCTSTMGWSPISGVKCDGGATTPTGPLVGGAGDITVTETSTDVETEVVEGRSEKVLGFKIEASDSDVYIKNLKVTLENDDSAGSYRLTDYADTVKLYMGSTEVASVDAADFSKDGHVYSKSMTLTDAIVREGSSKKATFYVEVEAASNIDSDDVDHNDWNIYVDNIRFQDATGVIMTANPSTDPEQNFEFTDLAGTGDVKLTISKGSSSPIARNVEVSDSGSTSNILMLEFKLKATGSDMSFDELSVNLTASAGATLSNILGDLTLSNGDLEITESTFDNDASQTLTFSLDDTFTIDQDSTETFRIYAKVNDVDNFASGQSVTVSFVQAGIAAEDSNGDVVTNEAGSVTGEAQTFVTDVPTFALVGTPTLAVSTHTDGTGAGEEDTYKATFVFNVTAPEDEDAYLPLDTFAYGTAGTNGFAYTVTGGATVTSAAMEYSGTGDIDETNGYMISAGTTEKFTATVYLTGNAAQGKVAITGVWYEISNVVPDGSPVVTSGFTNFKTPLVLLAK